MRLVKLALLLSFVANVAMAVFYFQEREGRVLLQFRYKELQDRVKIAALQVEHRFLTQCASATLPMQPSVQEQQALAAQADFYSEAARELRAQRFRVR